MDSLWSQTRAGEAAFRLERQDGRLHILYPAGRYRALAAVCLSLAIAAALLALLLPPMGAGTGTIRLAIGAFAAVLWLSGLALPFSALEIIVDRRELRVVRRWRGHRLLERRASVRTVTDVEIEQTGRAFVVSCVTSSGRIALFTGVASRQEAEALCSEFLAAAGLSRVSLQTA